MLFINKFESESQLILK